jgi:hypothetical protein
MISYITRLRFMLLLFVGDTDRIRVKCLHLLQELEDHIQTEIVDISRPALSCVENCIQRVL